MNRTKKIDLEILRTINKGYSGDLVETVYRKFMLTNFFRINKITRVEIFNHLESLKEIGAIKDA